MASPIPKRSPERRRYGSPGQYDIETIDLGKEFTLEVEIPIAPDEWEPQAKGLWTSFKRSGQAQFYEPTDWALAFFMCEQLHRELKPQVVGIGEDGEVHRARIPMKGASLTAFLKGMAQLLATEAERRRLKLEIERGIIPEIDVNANSNITDIREALFAVGEER